MTTTTTMLTAMAKIDLECISQLQRSLQVFRDNCDNANLSLTPPIKQSLLLQLDQLDAILEDRCKVLLAQRVFNPASAAILNATPGCDIRYDKPKP
jgi:hypothetical protein